MKNKAILPFVTTWMKPEGIMLNEMSHKERQVPYDFTSIWNLWKKSLRTENRLVVTRGRGLEMGKMGEGCLKVQNSTYKTNKF